MNKPATSWEDLPALQKRNAERLAEAKQKMGATWLLHPDNAKQRLAQTNMAKSASLS